MSRLDYTIKHLKTATYEDAQILLAVRKGIDVIGHFL